MTDGRGSALLNLNKSKILNDILLALGIYARRVSINPFSPYDTDNHVVLLEIREKFAKDEFVTFIRATSKAKDLNKVWEKYLDLNIYFCKNLFLFKVFEVQKLGLDKEKFIICCENYDYKQNMIDNTKYKLRTIPKKYVDIINSLEERLEVLEKSNSKNNYTSASLLLKKPV